MSYSELISELIEKHKKNGGKPVGKDIISAAKVISEGYVEKEFSADDAINFLCELNKGVTSKTFAFSFPKLSNEQKLEITEALVKNKRIAENKAGFGFSRLISAIVALLELGETDYFNIIMKWCAKHAEGNDSYKKSSELLKENCIKTLREKIFLCNYSDWKDNELKWLSRWFFYSTTNVFDESITKAYQEFSDKYILAVSDKDINPSKNNPVKDNNTLNSEKDASIVKNDSPRSEEAGRSDFQSVKKPQSLNIKEILSMLQNEINHIADERRHAVNENDRLRKRVFEQETRIKELLSQIDGIENSLKECKTSEEKLKLELIVKSQNIEICESKIKDLEDRLKSSFSADATMQNQELISFKRDLIKSLKNDYIDYMKLAEKEASVTYYGALLDLVEGVFDTLRRKEIDFAE